MRKHSLIILLILICGCASTNPFLKQYDDLRTDYMSGKITEEEFRSAYNKLQEQAIAYYENERMQNQRTSAIIANSIQNSFQEAREQNRKNTFYNNPLANAMRESNTYHRERNYYIPQSSHTHCYHIGDDIHCDNY